MKKLSLLLLLFSSSVFAESVTFSGTVSTSCSFSNTVAGNLQAITDGIGYSVTTDVGNGTRGSVDIAYSGSPTFSIQAPSGFSSAPGGTPTSSFLTGVNFSQAANNNAAITAGADSFSTGTKFLTLDSNSTTDTALFKFVANANSPYPVGSYSANVTFTCQ